MARAARPRWPWGKADGRAVRRPGAAGGDRAGPGRPAGRAFRRRAHGVTRFGHRPKGHGHARGDLQAGRRRRRPGHARCPRGGLRRSRGHGQRRPRRRRPDAGRGCSLMFGLGLRLTAHSGREALVRLIVTSCAVAVGVAIMLAVLADFHAFQVTNNRPNWENTVPATGRPASDRLELWNYSDEVFDGQTIERVDVAALGSHAPVLPGISKLPGASQYYASPALAALIRRTPRGELGDRFPGSMIGTIGDKALTGPTELVVYVGDAPSALASLPETIKVNKINSAPGRQVWSHYFRDAFIVGALAFLFPILILIGTATRLASARREERYASLRLVGATVRDINAIATAEAILTAALGAVLGIGVFALVQPALADTAITSQRYFASEVTPTLLGYLAVLVAVPLASAIASLLALRRVRITPLGVSRRVTPPPPTAWRMVPLLIGIALFVAGMLITNVKNIGAPAFPGLIVIMIGLVVGGPWLTARTAGLLPRMIQGASPIFAARRLADNPKGAFRSVSGLVLAVFLGTVVAALLPAINATTATPSARALSNVMLAGFEASPVCGNTVNCTGSNSPAGPFGPTGPGPGSKRVTAMAINGLPPAAGARLLAALSRFRDVTTVPVYTLPHGSGPPAFGTYTAVVGCAGMRVIRALGTCPPGVTDAQATAQNLYSDNPMFASEAIIGRHSPAWSSGVSRLYLQAVLIKVPNQATLERVRTFLITHTRDSVGGSAPRTFGEAVQARLGVADTAQRLIDIAVLLHLIVAGCS